MTNNPNDTTAGATPTEPLHIVPGSGDSYEFGGDHIFVKLKSAQTGGLLTLTEDNIEAGFTLGAHVHRLHTEIFYIVSGNMDFKVGEKSFTATAGSTVYVPPGVTHALKSPEGGKLIMIYSPGGLEDMLQAYGDQSIFQKLNPFAKKKFQDKYDFYEE